MGLEDEMVSQTVEKAIFIVFGLSVFVAIGIPTFANVFTFMKEDRANSELDHLRDIMQEGINLVEQDDGLEYWTDFSISCKANVLLVNESHVIKIRAEISGAMVEKQVISRTYNLTVNKNVVEGSFSLVIYLEGEQIHVNFYNKD